MDDFIAELESSHGQEYFADARKWAADAVFPGSKDRPTLAVLRLRAGLSQRGLAALMDKHQPYIARIEGGKENLTFDTLQRLASALGVDVGTIALAVEASRAMQEASDA